MSRKKTTAEFIEEARAVHGRKYDYALTHYETNGSQLVVVCRIHGDFRILPSNHIRGQGCRTCGIAKQHANLAKPYSEFVRQARKAHGTQYTYDEDSYRAARTKMRIFCPTHGEFLQSPEVHLRPHGCRKCAAMELGARTRLSIGDFRRRLRNKYGSKISYPGARWEGIHAPVKAQCETHGSFEALPTALLYQTHGCPDCAALKRGMAARLTQRQALQKLKKQFGSRYDLSQVDYRGSKQQVLLICFKHGEFQKTAEDLFSGSGCGRCAYEEANGKRLKNLRRRVREGHGIRFERFLSQAKLKHGDKLDYSRVKFTTQRAPILIGCPVHGFVRQVAMTHLRAGCRKCADAELKGRYSTAYFQRYPAERSASATLYYIHVEAPGEKFYKVGITKTAIRTRFSHLKGLGGNVRVLAEIQTTLAKAFEIEQEILKRYSKAIGYRPKLREAKRGSVVGSSECFSKPIPRYRRFFVGADAVK